MTRLIQLFFLFAATMLVEAAELRTYTFTVTNGSAITDRVYYNGTVRTGATLRTLYSWALNANTNSTASNMLSQLGAFPISGILVSQTSSNVLVFKGADLVVTSTPFASITVVTQALGTSLWNIQGPASAMVGTLQNSNGTEIVNYINATTNPISSVATGMVRFVGVTNVQTVYNKEITNSIVRNGTNDGTKLTNIPSAYISELYAVTINADGSTSVLSGTISGGKIIFASVTNAPWGSFSNLVAGKSFSASNAVIDGLTVTNLTGFGHDLEINEDGGNAWLTFDSTPTSSSQIFFNFNGTNAAYIECDTNELGFTFNGGRISIAADGSINIGTGSGAISRINSQIYGIFSTYLNTLQVTNIVGSNYISGRFASLSGSYPSLINGNNANIPTGTNSVLELSGGTTIAQIAGFVATGAGDEFEARFTGAVTNWIVNKSGSIFSTAGTAANRINTGTGGDITLTNQPAWARFRHNGTEWELKSYSR